MPRSPKAMAIQRRDLDARRMEACRGAVSVPRGVSWRWRCRWLVARSVPGWGCGALSGMVGNPGPWWRCATVGCHGAGVVGGWWRDRCRAGGAARCRGWWGIPGRSKILHRAGGTTHARRCLYRYLRLPAPSAVLRSPCRDFCRVPRSFIAPVAPRTLAGAFTGTSGSQRRPQFFGLRCPHSWRRCRRHRQRRPPGQWHCRWRHRRRHRRRPRFARSRCPHSWRRCRRHRQRRPPGQWHCRWRHRRRHRRGTRYRWLLRCRVKRHRRRDRPGTGVAQCITQPAFGGCGPAGTRYRWLLRCRVKRHRRRDRPGTGVAQCITQPASAGAGRRYSKAFRKKRDTAKAGDNVGLLFHRLDEVRINEGSAGAGRRYSKAFRKKRDTAKAGDNVGLLFHRLDSVTKTTRLTPGDKAPAFTLPDADGNNAVARPTTEGRRVIVSVTKTTRLTPGDKAPAFTLPDADGNNAVARPTTGKVVADVDRLTVGRGPDFGPGRAAHRSNRVPLPLSQANIRGKVVADVDRLTVGRGPDFGPGRAAHRSNRVPLPGTTARTADPWLARSSRAQPFGIRTTWAA